jgi:hypothetical protein
MSAAHRSGMYTLKSAQACPDVVTYAENTVVTQFSTLPVHPACCGATHAVASPCLSCAVSSMAMPGPIRSPGSHGSHAAARAGSSPRSSCQSHRYEPSRACIRCQPSCPAASAIDQQFAFVPGDSALTYPDATSALRRCASTRPRTTLTCASTRAAHAATSSILAHAAVSSVSVSTRQALCHGRLKLQEGNPAEPLPSHLP